MVRFIFLSLLSILIFAPSNSYALSDFCDDQINSFIADNSDNYKEALCEEGVLKTSLFGFFPDYCRDRASRVCSNGLAITNVITCEVQDRKIKKMRNKLKRLYRKLKRAKAE